MAELTQQQKQEIDSVVEKPSKQETESKSQESATDLRQQISMDLTKRALSVKTNFMQPEVWKQIAVMARAFKNSGAIPSYIKNEYQLIMVMQAGYEMGMKPVESIKSLYIVNGSITIYAEAITRRLNEWGFEIDYEDEPDKCTAIITHRDSDKEIRETYTYQQAADSGYTTDNSGKQKVGWKKGENRLVKLRYGALRRAIKTRIAYVMGSVIDIKEVAEDYQPIETEKKKSHSISEVKPLSEVLSKGESKAENE